MMNVIVQLCAAFVGTLGFCLLFRLRRGLILPACVGSVVTWGLYLLMQHFGADIFVSCLAASCVAELYALILSRSLRVPSILLSLPSVIPLIPGGDLYYTLSAAVAKNEALLRYHGVRTLEFALAIAAGLSILWAFWIMIFPPKKNQ